MASALLDPERQPRVLSELGEILPRARAEVAAVPQGEVGLAARWGTPDGRIMLGDNLAAMRALHGQSAFDLIYLDPPYDSSADYFRELPDGEKQPAYADRFASTLDYLSMLAPRLLAAQSLLTPTGLICIHVDQRVSPYVRVLGDAIFGRDRLVNELIWRYGKMSNARRRFAQAHDTVVVYAVTDQWYFEPVRVAPSEYRERFRRHLDGELLRFGAVRGSADKLIARRVAKRVKELGRDLVDSDVLWDFAVERKAQDDVFTDISLVKGNAAENARFDTQKPVALLDRLLTAFCPPGGVVLDPFLGSGTTAVAARRAGRSWVGMDASKAAVHTAWGRLGDDVQVDFLTAPPRLEAASLADFAGARRGTSLWLDADFDGRVVRAGPWQEAGGHPEHLGVEPVDWAALSVDRYGEWAWATRKRSHLGLS